MKKKTVERTAFPKDPPYVELKRIRATLMNDFKRYTNGSMMMTVTEAGINEDQKKIGSIRFCITGSGIGIYDDRTGRTYRVAALDIWKAFELEKDSEISE